MSLHVTHYNIMLYALSSYYVIYYHYCIVIILRNTLYHLLLSYFIIHIITISAIAGLTLQFAIQNGLGCYLKLNLGSKFHAEVATYLPHVKLRTLYIH